jgi:hypothetical protein
MTIRSLRFLAALAALSGGASMAAVNLPALNIDTTQTTVSGLSSGGFMAVQLHVAYSATVQGRGRGCGGPFYCAKDRSSMPRGAAWPRPGIPHQRWLISTTNTWATRA